MYGGDCNPSTPFIDEQIKQSKKVSNKVLSYWYKQLLIENHYRSVSVPADLSKISFNDLVSEYQQEISNKSRSSIDLSTGSQSSSTSSTAKQAKRRKTARMFLI